jgi:phosphatidylglycerol:prolipoprotein diacylglycerol transferase
MWFFPFKNRLKGMEKIVKWENSVWFRTLRAIISVAGLAMIILVILAYFSSDIVKIDSYSVLFIAGFIAGGWVLSHRLKKQGIDSADFLQFSAVITLSAIIGARLFYALFEFGIDNLPPPIAFFHYPSVFFYKQGGFVIYGGLIAGTISGYIYAKRKKFPVGSVADAAIAAVFLGIFFGRLGCLFNGCCFGERCNVSNPFTLPWNSFQPGTAAHDFHYHSQHYSILNTQLISALAALIFFMLFTWLYYKKIVSLKNILFPLGATSYALFRFIIEIYRADNPPIAFGMSISQLISIIVFATSLLMILFVKRKHKQES